MHFGPNWPLFWEFPNVELLKFEKYFINRCLWCFCYSSYHLLVEKISITNPKSTLNQLSSKNNVLKLGWILFSCKLLRTFILLKEVTKVKILIKKRSQQIFQSFSRYFASLSRFLKKYAKISKCSQHLHCLCTEYWDGKVELFEVFDFAKKPSNSLSFVVFQGTVQYSDVLFFTPPNRILYTYQNC